MSVNRKVSIKSKWVCGNALIHMDIFPQYNGNGFGWTCREENLSEDSRNSATKIKQALLNIEI
ncbi:hypothetical protein CM318V1_1510011 [Carnobacterium maltaromaticum]|nr:hypothetical protein CM318V1_1510011 [Carnobacterium maltaromaticum]